MDAVDKLISQTIAANMKWKIITGAATGITSIIASALPIAGLAASVTRLATDVAILLKQSYHLNRWRNNIALTYATRPSMALLYRTVWNRPSCKSTTPPSKLFSMHLA